MNKHFADARYYLGRAAEHAAAGARVELKPVTERVAGAVDRGADDEPEPSRSARLRGGVASLATRTASEARRAVVAARGRVAAYRGRNAGER